jgi:hypothetical protein
MPGRGQQTFKKRQKEQQRKEKQEEKMARRLARKDEAVPPAAGEENAEVFPVQDLKTETLETDNDVR